MKQLLVDVLRHVAALTRRSFLHAAFLAGLVLAAVCLAASSVEGPVAFDGHASGEAQAELDTSESSDASDEGASHARLVISPAAITDVARLETPGTGRSGFRSRVPRPSDR